MKLTVNQLLLGLTKTILFLVVMEIFISTILPIIGIHQFKPTFNVLIILYLAFKLNVSFLPFIILLLQVIHGAFSIDGWALGTIIGIVISILVKFAKDMISFSTGVTTIVIVSIFHLIWNLLFAALISVKINDFGSFFSWFFNYLPEAIFISLLSPLCFRLFDWFWYVDKTTDEVSF